MDRKYAKYMKYGKTVKSRLTGKTFKLVEDMDEKKSTVEVVNIENKARYDLLGAWIRNWEQNCCGFRERFEGNIEDCRKERQSYVEKVKISDVEPNDVIRFITPGYETKFEVKDLSVVSVGGKLARVVYVDDYHFSFAYCDMSIWCGCFHICQYAELCERNGIEVKPID